MHTDFSLILQHPSLDRLDPIRLAGQYWSARDDQSLLSDIVNSGRGVTCASHVSIPLLSTWASSVRAPSTEAGTGTDSTGRVPYHLSGHKHCSSVHPFSQPRRELWLASGVVARVPHFLSRAGTVNKLQSSLFIFTRGCLRLHQPPCTSPLSVLCLGDVLTRSEQDETTATSLSSLSSNRDFSSETRGTADQGLRMPPSEGDATMYSSQFSVAWD